MNKIRSYLTNEKKMPSVLIERNINKLELHPDIADEFSDWIDVRKYKETSAVTVEGYTAKKIFEMASFLDGIGVFNFLITLREQPEKAKQQLALGFPRK